MAPTTSDQQKQWWQRSIARRTEAYLEDEVAKVTANSRFFSSHGSNRNDVALLNRSEVQIGSKVGQGAFSEVHEITGFRVSNLDCRNEGEDALLQKDAIDESGKCRYVIKHLRKSLIKHRTRFHHAAADLMVEAKFLSSLNHPNIIDIKGWARGETSSYSEGRYDGFFLILDRVDEILSQRIARWKEEKPLSSLSFSSLHYHADQLQFGLQIASALDYMHDNGIIYRDLKPDNIGIQGNTVKLFDFGLCRELPNFTSPEKETRFLMTKVGTRRYMAPEVALRRGYNLKADVYSWAIVFYEMVSMQQPYEMYNEDLHRFLVCEEGGRPKLNAEWPSEIKELMTHSWTQKPWERLRMKQICNILRDLTNAEEAFEVSFTGTSCHEVAEPEFEQPKPIYDMPEVLAATPRYNMAEDYYAKLAESASQATDSTMSSSGWGSSGSDCGSSLSNL